MIYPNLWKGNFIKCPDHHVETACGMLRRTDISEDDRALWIKSLEKGLERQRQLPKQEQIDGFDNQAETWASLWQKDRRDGFRKLRS